MTRIADAPVQPVPNHRDLYLLIAGVVAGLLLGPAILGRVAPDAYQRVFVGHVPDVNDQARLVDRLRATGATDVAVNERLAELRQLTEQAQRQRLQSLQGLVTAIVMAMAAVMTIESLVDPAARQARAGLATARYALIAIWLALVLARPVLLQHISVGFLVLLLVIALIAALVPLRRTAS